MADLGTMTYHGTSGIPYQFTVYAWGTAFKAVAAVYVISRRTQRADGGWTHSVIYVGETGDLSERFEDHHKVSCFAAHAANCICIHRDADANSRLQKEGDLTAN